MLNTRTQLLDADVIVA